MTDRALAPLLRPTWHRLRLWVVLGLLVVAGGLVAGLLAVTTSSPKAPLDPTSPAQDGSKALAALLRARGTTISKLTSPADAAETPSTTTVLVVDPDDLGVDQLRALAGHRVVLVDPDVTSLAARTDRYERDDVVDSNAIQPGCTWPGARAAGPLTFPDATSTYVATDPGPSGDGEAAGTTCYGGAVVVTDRLVVLGSGDLLRNDKLANNDIAALDLNAISADGTVSEVAWLLPGLEDSGGGSPSIWALFPPWTQRAFWWLLVVGVLATLWRARRFGPVVSEPLPVVVRSAEVVEGLGRLYRQAQARERAAALMRAATVTRLAARLGLDRHTSAGDVAAGLATGSAWALTGPVPADDAALVRLARDLHELEAGSVRAVQEPES